MSEVDLEKFMREHKQDAEDKRCRRGKYAPKSGVCRVCGSSVVAEISFNHGDRIGGPPVNGCVSGWYCKGCQLVYRTCPPAVGDPEPPSPSAIATLNELEHRLCREREPKWEPAVDNDDDDEWSGAPLAYPVSAPSQPPQDAQPVERAALVVARWLYATSWDAEDWSGPHDTLDDALEAARSDYAGSRDSFWVARSLNSKRAK